MRESLTCCVVFFIKLSSISSYFIAHRNGVEMSIVDSVAKTTNFAYCTFDEEIIDGIIKVGII